MRIFFSVMRKILNDYLFAVFKRLYFHLRHGRVPRGFNFKNPKTFNEKINYLKLYRKEPTGSMLADKADVKNYVKNKIGEKFLIPTIGIFNSVEEILIEKLPKAFVIKATHASGMNLICRDKSAVNWTLEKKVMKQWLQTDYASWGGEWQYNLKPRLICEKYLENTAEKSLYDYKIFCFGGEPEYIQVDIDRCKKHCRNFYDRDWQLQPFSFAYKKADKKIDKPERLSEMLEIARKLSEGYDFLRVDLFYYEDEIFFGELTFHPGGGCEFITPYHYDKKLGDLLLISNGNVS